MEQFEVRLNNFLFNSGVLGFYNILKHVKKEKYILEYRGEDNYRFETGNRITIKKEALDGFEVEYIDTMLDTYSKDTRWYKIKELVDTIQEMKLEEKEDLDKFKNYFDFIKKALESASYKSGYEIIKTTNTEQNPYEILELAKKEKDMEKKRQMTLQLAKHIKENRRVYGMKDIMYNKINVFWENVAFLNRNNNKNDIQEEYKKIFVDPAIEYLEEKQKSEYTCIECGNVVSKSNANSLGWLKDVGVDINRKKSGFWDFKEDAFICPICNLIYSCVPLGFTMIGSNGIFINDNNNMEMLIMQNASLAIAEDNEEEKFEKIYQKVFRQFLNYTNQRATSKASDKEPKNIQVVKRMGRDKDHIKYEFNRISKEKLEIFAKVQQHFEKIINKYIKINKDTLINVYDQVLSNFLENKKQYGFLNSIVSDSLSNNTRMDFIYHILKIQLNSIGGINVQEMDDLIEKMIKAGRDLQITYSGPEENANKLKSYIFKLNNSLRVGNAMNFMDIVSTMYAGLGRSIPAVKAFEKILKDKESFKILGYAYILGLKQYLGNKDSKKDDIEGGENI